MKIMVTVKSVIDPELKIKLKSDGSGIESEGLNRVVNPFDEIAVEEALRIVEKFGGEVFIVTIGSSDCVTQMRSALAMGAERGILVKYDEYIDNYNIAQILSKVYEMEKPDIVLMGKQAVDDDSNQVAQMLAGILELPQATFASKIEIDEESKKAVVTREVDGGLMDVEVALPAVITADLRLNEPRYPSLPGIMKAKKKEIKEMTPEELGVTIENKIEIVSYEEPPKRSGGEILPDVDTLIDRLKNTAKVI